MARTARNTLPPGEADLSPDEQTLLDQMRADEGSPQPVEPEPQPSPPPIPPQPEQEEEPGEPPAAAADEQPPADDRPRMVPHAALHEERLRRQQLEQTLTAERKARETLEQRTNMLLERMNQSQQPQQPDQPAAPAPLPDPQINPVEHIMARLQRGEGTIQQQQEMIGALTQVLQARQQQDQQAQEAQRIQQEAIATEQEFAARTPDYVEAVGFLHDLRNRQLRAAGWENPAERQQIISQEAFGIMTRARQMGLNPAEIVYNLAKESGHGRSSPPPPPPPPNGVQPPAINGEITPPTPQQRLARVAQGQQQNQATLGNVRGTAPPPLTVDRLLEMNNDEFGKLLETSQEARDLMGV